MERVRLNGGCGSWRRLYVALGLAAVASLTSHAHGLEVGLQASGCPDMSEARVRDLAALELTARVVAPDAPRSSGALVRVSCSGDQVSIRVTDLITGKEVMRAFRLTEREPDVRARAVALAVAELVLTSWLELMLPQVTSRESSAQTKQDRREASEIVHRRAGRGAYVDGVLAFAEAGGTFRAAPSTLGAGLRLSVVFAEPTLTMDADLSTTLASSRSTLGDIRVNTWSLAVRPAFRLRTGPWLGTLGAGARAGLVRIEGEAADPSSSRGRAVVGSWGGPLVHANVGVVLSHFATRLGGEAGYSLRGISGSVDGSERAGVRGAWVMLSLGIGWGA